MAPPDSMPETGALSALYPFLPPVVEDLDLLLAAASASTAAKTDELAKLRQQVLAHDGDRIAACAQALAAAFAAGGRLFTFGNGGSATDAADLASLFLCPGPPARPLPAFPLTADVAAVTALSNDAGFDVVFARQLAATARPGDIAIGLSSSGKSDNLVAAFRQASRQGLVTVALSGYAGGQLAELPGLDYLFEVPSASIHRIQEAQTTVYHVLWELTLAALAAAEQVNRAATD